MFPPSCSSLLHGALPPIGPCSCPAHACLPVVPFMDLTASSIPHGASPHAVAAFHNMLIRADAKAACHASEALDAIVSRLVDLDPCSLTSSLCHVERLADVVGLLTRALGSCLDSVLPLVVSVVVNGLCKSGLVDDACRLLNDMPRNGVKLNVLWYNLMLDCYDIVALATS
jgi:pentatricopeptide repeat protein